MCTKYQFQACVILDRSSCTSSWTASMTLVFDCEKCDAWMLVKFILIEIYTAENFDLKSHFISWMVDSLLPFFYLSVLWFRVFESFRFLSSINFLRSSLSTWFLQLGGIFHFLFGFVFIILDIQVALDQLGNWARFWWIWCSDRDLRFAFLHSKRLEL